MAIFKNQTLLTIQLNTGIDVSASTTTKVLYQKPNNTSGEWTATVSGTNVVYDVQSSDLDVAGTWKVQPLVTIGGKVGYGEIKPMLVSDTL